MEVSKIFQRQHIIDYHQLINIKTLLLIVIIFVIFYSQVQLDVLKI